MPIVDGVLFSKKDMLSPFQCDLERCKGACCFIEGELGAPLKHNEISQINSLLKFIWDLLPQKSKEVIYQSGWWIKRNGQYYTNVVNKRECVFAFFENGIARCSIEKLYHEGKISFRKPISCHLFPFREHSFFFSELVYVKIPECENAIEKGIQENVPLFVSLKEALVRRFGQKWYKNLLENEINATIEFDPNSGVSK